MDTNTHPVERGRNRRLHRYLVGLLVAALAVIVPDVASAAPKSAPVVAAAPAGCAPTYSESPDHQTYTLDAHGCGGGGVNVIVAHSSTGGDFAYAWPDNPSIDAMFGPGAAAAYGISCSAAFVCTSPTAWFSGPGQSPERFFGADLSTGSEVWSVPFASSPAGGSGGSPADPSEAILTVADAASHGVVDTTLQLLPYVLPLLLLAFGWWQVTRLTGTSRKAPR